MIYFITARDLGRVKIGYSEEPRSRFIKMRTDSPVTLALERIRDGGVDVERTLHARFAAYRLNGEWFNLSPEIEAYMERCLLCAPHLREKSLLQIMVEATGMSKSYASQILSDRWPHQITIPIAISVFRHCGKLIGPLVGASPEEVDVLEKYVGRFGSVPVSERAA